VTTIFDAYTFIRQLTDKAGKGFVSPEEVSGWLEASQLTLFNTYRAAGVLDNITQTAISPFAKPYPFSTPSGSFAKPGDFVQALRVVNSAGLEHTPVLFNELRDALASRLNPIARYPRYTEGETYIGLYPQVKTSGTLTYYRMPVAPVIGYTNNGDGSDVVYDATTSVQLEMPKAHWMQIIMNSLPYLGVNLSDADVFQLAQTSAA
jgi:hypothetical protein